MFYIDKLKEQIAKVSEMMRATLAHIDSPEFAEEAKRQYPGHSTAPSKLGHLSGMIQYSAHPALAHAAWQLEQALPEIADLERYAAVCEALGIDAGNLDTLELLVKSERYRNERRDICTLITNQSIGIRDELERDNAVEMLEAAGFMTRDDFDGWERTSVAPTPAVERVTIDTKNRNGEFWYEFTYEERAGVETLRGKSGQFGELLAAVGISQYFSGGDEVNDTETALILRNVRADMTSYGGFLWPSSGPVEAPDWNPEFVCGGGLHGLLWGEGSTSYFYDEGDVLWIVFRAAISDICQGYGDLVDKCKARTGIVEFCGSRDGAVTYLLANGGMGRAVVYGTATAGDAGTATAGYAGTATAGARGTATAGDDGTATAGDDGTATAGDDGTATAGYAGTATAGYAGTATAGDAGTATAGDAGTATAGDDGTATAGDDGEIRIRYWDGKRRRTRIGYIGEDGLMPNKKYRLNNDAQFMEQE